MLVYDSMRVRDDLRQDGDNEFWVTEHDALRLKHQRDQLREALELIEEDAYERWVRSVARASLKATEEG